MRQEVMTVAQAAARIEEGATLLVAGDARALGRLPRGRWLGGTIPYFMSLTRGGLVSTELVFVSDISDAVTDIEIVSCDADRLARIYLEGPREGFSFVIIPAMSRAHRAFALNAPNYKGFGTHPLIGWVAGVHLDDMGRVAPKAFNGLTGEALEQDAMVLHAVLKPNLVAEVGIINLFEQGDGDILTFPADGFSAREVTVNGERREFAEYILSQGLDTRLPLVANYYGASVNISFQSVDAANGLVTFYAPVFTGIRYKHARPVADYREAFQACLAREGSLAAKQVIFSCNCIVNYLHSELEGQTTEPFAGPVTFGEIAYQLLNQTLVYLEIHDI